MLRERWPTESDPHRGRRIPPALVMLGLTSTLPAGATVVHEGDPIRHVAILLEGVVEAVDRHTFDVPGTLLTPPGIVDGEVASVTVRAVTPVALLLLGAGDLQMVASEPDVASWVADQSGSWPKGKRGRTVESRGVVKPGAGDGAG